MLSTYSQVTSPALTVVKMLRRDPAAQADNVGAEAGWKRLDAPSTKSLASEGVDLLNTLCPSGERPSFQARPRPALGTMAGSVENDGAEALRRRRSKRRYLNAILDTVASLLPKERVAGCGRRPIGSAVSIISRDGIAQTIGVQTCAAVWLCPCCSPVISGGRRRELNRLLAWGKAQGLTPVMLTLTARHHRHMPLTWLLQRTRGAKKRFHQSSDWRGMKPLIEGHVTATECPCGRNGFHLHTHTILLVRAANEAAAVSLLKGLRGAWERALEKEGLDCNDHGFDVRGHAGAGDYVAKWGAAEELTFSQAKADGDPKKGRTPWQLLAIAAGLIGDDVFTASAAREKWLEFATAIKGRRQLVWSRGLKARAGINDRTDEELVEEICVDAVEREIGRLSVPEWRAVVRAGLRVTLLEQAESLGRAGIEAVVRLALSRRCASTARRVELGGRHGKAR